MAITLRMTRAFTAPREKVFRAWTDPKELKRWFAPSDDYAIPLVEVDLRVGGRYRIQMKSPDGETYTVGGAYREIVVPARLVYTWAWEGGAHCGTEAPEEHQTLVTVEFHERGGTTEVVLTHDFFPNVEEKEKHSHGWVGCLDRLGRIVLGRGA